MANMTCKAIVSMRDVIQSFKEEFIIIDKEVDPIYEIAGIQKALDGSYALLFNKIKGYPQARCIGNVFSRSDRIAKIFGVDNPKEFKFKCLQAIKHPIQPRIVKDAPCQEVVITDNADVMSIIPILKHSSRDGARVLSDAIYFLSGEYFRNGMEISFKRTHFRAKDWGSVFISPGCHFEKLLTTELRGRDVPITANICTPPSVNLVAAAHFLHTVVPPGTNEVAIAGGLNGVPIDIVKAKTVDAYAIANSESLNKSFFNLFKSILMHI